MWQIERIINFGKSGQFSDGYARFGFHDDEGNQYVLAYDFNWIGFLSSDDHFHWTAGEKQQYETEYHYDVEINKPTYLSKCHDGSILVTVKDGVLRLSMETKKAEMIIESEKEGIGFIGNAVIDNDHCIWINDVCGYKIHRYNEFGELIEIVGTGELGFSKDDVPFQNASFNWIYDIRKGAEGNIYVLDSKNYSVRMLDLEHRIVRLVAGTGEPGYSGDNGDPLNATFGGDTEEHFDGPWSLSIDESNNIYVGDTQNHVLRMIDRENNTITTIAGNPNSIPGKQNDPKEIDLFNLNLPKICGLDYSNGKLFIPEWDGDLIVLKRV